MTRFSDEADLRRRAEHLAAAQRIAQIGSWETDLTDNRLMWSDEVYRIFGTTPEAFAGTLEAFLAFVPPDDRRRLEAAHQQVLTTGAVLDLEHRIIRPDGDVRHVHERGERVDEGGRVRLAGTVQDITERVRSARQVESFFDLSVDLMCVASFDGTFIRVNRAMEEALGYNAAECYALPALALVHPDDRARTLMASTELKGGKPVRGLVNRYRTKSGAWRDLAWSMLPVLEERLVYGVARDVTEQSRAAELLRQSEERFRELAETIEDVFWTWDARADRIIYVSPSYETVFGQSREELFRDSRSFHRMIDPEDLPHLMEVLADDPYTVAVEYRIVRADGQRRWVDVRTFPVRDADGEVARVVGIGRDITQLKTAEQTLLRSQRMESIGALAGGIAHDINNILTPILMAADVLSGMASTKAERDLTETIQQSAERGATMVRQVLSFARGVDGRHTTLELHRILSDLARLAHDTFDRRIAIDTRIDGALWPVAGDATQMHQVLLNLCVNARDAMPEGGVLRLTAVNSLIDRANAAPDEDVPDGRYVCITVADTGGGVAAAIRERIFDPFFTTKPQGQGTGLGLPTAQAIVRSHGGVLSLASSAETGATFQILLPALHPEESISGELPAPALTRGNGEMVLVVDDEPAVRFVTRETLETFNYRVLLASNGTEAVPLLSDQQQPIALVVTDMMMPVLDGFGVIEAARRLRPALPIIAASGLDVDGMAARAVEAGARVFLSKPYTAHTLLQTVADVLAASNPAEAQ